MYTEKLLLRDVVDEGTLSPMQFTAVNDETGEPVYIRYRGGRLHITDGEHLNSCLHAYLVARVSGDRNSGYCTFGDIVAWAEEHGVYIEIVDA